MFGLSGSVGAHAVVVGGWIGTATGRSRRRPWALALLNGLGLAGAVAHFLAWPTRWRRALLLLTDGVEGLGGGWAPWYNPLLYLWGAAAVVAVGRETAAGERRWALLGMGALPAVAAASHAKHVWGRDEASPRPRWWYRALR